MKRSLRNTQGELIFMKQKIIGSCISSQLKCKDGAKLLEMHPKVFSRLTRRYLEHGIKALIPEKPGPKKGNRAPNRTPEEIEDLVVALACEFRFLGSIPLSKAIEELYGIKINDVTVWRILTRRKVRYTYKYEKIDKPKPILYCHDEPGIEV